MKKEHFFAILIALAALVINNLPIFYFNLVKKDSLVFLNRRFINSQDVYTYVSFIEQSKQGRNLFENLYTSEPQKANLFRPSYLLAGKIASLLNISSIATYHLFRILFSILFFFILYIFLHHFFDQPTKRLLAFTIILTSSGLGFILKKWFPDSTDLWIPESITFLSLAEAPHFILSQILMLSGFHFLLTFSEKKKFSSLLLSTLSFLFLSFEHPFNLFVIMPIIFFFSLWSGLSFAKSLLLVFINSAGIIFQLIQTSQNPILKLWQTQNILLSPAPSQYLGGFGFLLAFVLIGFEKCLRQFKDEKSYKLVLLWIFITVILLYSPFSFQRRFIEGVHIPISIIATVGILAVYDRLKGPFKVKSKILISRILVIVSVLILSLSSFCSISEDFRLINGDSIDSYYYYLASPEVQAINWLKENTNFNNIVLTNWFYGNLIPGISGRKVFLGHKIQTSNFDLKVEKINSFLLEENNDSALSFLKENQISFIFLGLNDSMLGYGFKPDQKPFLERIYDKEDVLIYKVKPN